MQLDDWQNDILKEEGNILLAKGRRIGATHVFAIKAVEYMIKHKSTHPSSQIVCVSLTEDQAQLIVAFATDYANIRCPKLIGTGKDRPTLNRLVLNVKGNRRILLSRPVGTTGDGARGFEGQILMVDEASRMPNSFWEAAKPILATTGGKIWMWSTFFGKKGYFWDRYEEAVEKKDPKARFKVWNKSTEEVFNTRPISESWTEKQREEGLLFLEAEKKEMSALTYAQEYLGIPSSDLKQFFSDEWIEKVCVKEKLDRVIEGKHYLGVDIARMGGDQNAYAIITEGLRKFYQSDIVTERYKLTNETEDKIVQIAEMWKVKKVGLDAGSGTLGVSILDHLRLTKIKNKVIPMNNREIVIEEDGEKQIEQRMLIEDLYNNLKSMGEHREIELLRDADVMLSLRSIQMEFVTNNQGRLKLRITGKYNHITEAIVRAAFLAKKEKSLNLFAF